MENMNDIYEAKELLEENLHSLIAHVKKNCEGDLLEHNDELCTMKMLLSCLSKSCEIEAMEQQSGGENSQRGGNVMRSYGAPRGGRGMENGNSGARRRNRMGRFYDDGTQDVRQEMQEMVNRIPDRQTRMDYQRMLDGMGDHD